MDILVFPFPTSRMIRIHNPPFLDASFEWYLYKRWPFAPVSPSFSNVVSNYLITRELPYGGVIEKTNPKYSSEFYLAPAP